MVKADYGFDQLICLRPHGANAAPMWQPLTWVDRALTRVCGGSGPSRSDRVARVWLTGLGHRGDAGLDVAAMGGAGGSPEWGNTVATGLSKAREGRRGKERGLASSARMADGDNMGGSTTGAMDGWWQLVDAWLSGTMGLLSRCGL